MIQKVFSWIVIVFVVGGLIMYVKDHPKSAGKSAAHVVNETGDAGAGMWQGIATFFGELDF